MDLTSSSSSSSRHSTGGNTPRWYRRRTSDQGALTPPELLKAHSLPVAAYFYTNDAPPGLDTSQPLLLYRNYTSTKVRAASLQISQESGLLAVGPTLVIPETYTGWFSIVTTKGKSAFYFSTIEEVAKAQPSFFLTRFEIPAYVKEVDATDSRRFTYRKVTIQSGYVLKLLGIFEDLNRRRPEHSRNRYVQCLNHSNETVYIPFAVTGRFYETAPRGSSNSSHVYLMSQLITTFQLPLTVRLVCGYMPRVPQAFTGVLRLEKMEKESVILACTMTSEARATLLEMDVASNFLLRPVTDPVFVKTPIFLKSVSYCAEEADSWQRQIKVIHHVTEDESESLLRHSTGGSTMSTSSLGINLSLFSDFDKIRVKEKTSKAKSEKGINFKLNKSRDLIKSIDKNKENRDSEDSKSKESRLKIKVKDKIQDMNRNPQYVVNGEFISIRVDDKLSGKKGFDNRKLSKQNTYIFQNDRIVKKPSDSHVDPEPDISSISIDNQEYATVLDDISHRSSDPKPDLLDVQYAEICEHKVISDSRTGIVKLDIKGS